MEFLKKALQSYDSLSDQELVLLLRNNDKQAYTQVFRRYHKSIYYNILKIIKDKEQAEDLLQNCFETLWDKRALLDASRPVNGWLFKLSYFRAIDWLRLKAKEQREQEVYFHSQAQMTNTEPDLTERQLEYLKRAMDMLSPQKRKVLEMCKLEQKSYEKTASELGISKYTVGEYLKEAMAFLRKEALSQDSSEIKTI